MVKGNEYKGEDGVCRLICNGRDAKEGFSIENRWREAMELVERN